MTYDKIIIGAGLYGLYSALRCGERGYAIERYISTLFAGKPETDGETTEVEAKDGADKLKKAYFAVRGWSKDGVPSEAALKKLGIRKGNQ